MKKCEQCKSKNLNVFYLSNMQCHIECRDCGFSKKTKVRYGNSKKDKR